MKKDHCESGQNAKTGIPRTVPMEIRNLEINSLSFSFLITEMGFIRHNRPGFTVKFALKIY